MSFVAGIVLAAGRSSRMGQPKALLELGGETFLARSVRVLVEAGCDPVVAVVPPGEEQRMGPIAAAAGGRAVENPRADAEQIDSLRVGLAEIEERSEAAIVLPVDHPLAIAAVAGALKSRWLARRDPIVRPTYRGQPGHPVLFARPVWAELDAPDLEHGARDVVHRHRAEIAEIEVGDAGVTVDVNTPAEYERVAGR